MLLEQASAVINALFSGVFPTYLTRSSN